MDIIDIVLLSIISVGLIGYAAITIILKIDDAKEKRQKEGEDHGSDIKRG